MLDTMTNATLFAPNNDAIRAVPDAIKQSWINNPEKLKEVLSYHLIQPQVRQPQLANNQQIETSLKGQSIRMNFYQSVRNILFYVTIEGDVNDVTLIVETDSVL